MVVSSIVAAVLVLIYRFLCSRDNKCRDESGTIEAFEHANEDDLTDKTVCSSKLIDSLHDANILFPESPVQIYLIRRISCLD